MLGLSAFGASLAVFSKIMRRSMLGLDIGSTAVKLLELSRTADGYRVEACGIAPLPQQAVVEKQIKDVQRLGDCIQQLVADCKPRSKQVAVAMAGSAVISKQIAMPAGLNEWEMESLLQTEADQHIPYPLEEVALDFNIQAAAEAKAQEVGVLIVACRKEHIEMRAAALKLGGLHAQVVDLEAYCMQRALANTCSQLASSPPSISQPSSTEEPPVIAVVDIGASMTTLNVFTADMPYTREQLFGARQLTEAIQQRYELSPEEATLARQAGTLPDDYEAAVLQPFREAVVQQVNRSLQFFYSASNCRDVEQIILAGGTANIEGLASMVTEKLGCPCRVANPFADMALGTKVNPGYLTQNAPAMMIACGLALRGF